MKHSYNGNNQFVKDYVNSFKGYFFDFNQRIVITQPEVDAAFSVLEALLNGDMLNPEAWIIKCKDGFPYKTFVCLTDKIICKFDTKRTSFCDKTTVELILEVEHFDKYETADLNTYIECLNKWGIENVNESRVFERAIMQARSKISTEVYLRPANLNTATQSSAEIPATSRSELCSSRCPLLL